MPKRRGAPRFPAWVRDTGPDLRLHLADGTILMKARDVTEAEARDLAERLPAYRISYGSPVRELGRGSDALRDELDLTEDCARYEGNTAALFRAPDGREVLVLEHHH